MALFLTAVTEVLNPPEEPHPLLSEPLPPPHEMAGYIHELRERLVDAEGEIEYLHGRVRRAESDNAYLCRQVTVLTDQREALRDRLEGRGEFRKVGRKESKEWTGSVGRKDKSYKEGRYA
jgi:hypothetical protein